MPAAKAGIKAGDEILSADGKPFEEIGSFNHKAGSTVAVEVRHTAGAAPVTIPVSVEKTSPLATYMEAIRDSARIIDQGGRRVGYVHLWTGAGDLTGVLNEVLATTLKDADGIVVDMRSRWGGGPADAAEAFVGGSADMIVTENDGKPQYANTRFRKPVVAIIDEGTRSSMEIMAYGLKKNGIPLVGAPTAGDVLAARAFALPDDSILELPVADVTVDGQRLEGNPVTPTVPVAFDVRYANGADPQMDAALAELGKKLAGGELGEASCLPPLSSFGGAKRRPEDQHHLSRHSGESRNPALSAPQKAAPSYPALGGTFLPRAGPRLSPG